MIMRKCTDCETIYPPNHENCPKCGSAMSVLPKPIKSKGNISLELEDTLVNEPVSPMANHSVSNLWMNVSGL